VVGATAIAMAPITPINPLTVSSPAVDVRAAAAISTEFELTALDVPYILTLPIVRQYIVNWAENWAVYLAGLAKSGVGLAESLLAIPGVTVEIVQEMLALDFVGAFDTFTSAVRDSVIAVGQPLLDSLIWRNQKFYAVQTALQAAVPQAFIDITNGFLTAANGVTTSVIVGTQNLVAAILTLNLSAIVDAVVDGTTNFFVALGAGAGAIVDGIEAAQLGIATALATDPPATTAADVAALRTLAVDTTISFAPASDAVTLDVGPTQEKPTTSEADISGLVDSAAGLSGTTSEVTDGADLALQEETTGGADVAGTGEEAEPLESPEEPADAALTGDPTSVKDAPKEVEETVKKVTVGDTKGPGDQADTGPTNDAGSADKTATPPAT
jgi:hypothetical protein